MGEPSYLTIWISGADVSYPHCSTCGGVRRWE